MVPILKVAEHSVFKLRCDRGEWALRLDRQASAMPFDDRGEGDRAYYRPGHESRHSDRIYRVTDPHVSS